jgi:hypothetical protein
LRAANRKAIADGIAGFVAEVEVHSNSSETAAAFVFDFEAAEECSACHDCFLLDANAYPRANAD